MLKRAQGLLPLLLLLSAGNVIAADLRITDTSGFEILITGAIIDYGGLMADRETQGIRVTQGEAVVTAKWAEINSVAVTGRDASVTPAKISLEIVLKNGKTVTAGLIRKGKMMLSGKSDLGDYSIDVEKIRKITIVQAR